MMVTWTWQTFCTHDFNAHEGLIAFHPCVMPWWGGVGLARLDCLLRAIAHAHRETPRDNMAHMTHLTGLGTHYRFDGLRPTPTRLQLEATDGKAGQSNYLDTSLVR
jgi:hypothetical protein